MGRACYTFRPSRYNGYASQRFQRAHRHDLWQGDIKYGPNLMLNGFPTQTYLSCLIDDATRYIVHAEFYADMEQTIVEDTLHKAVVKYGAPQRLYFDNGSQYRTHWMKRACGLMGIRLLYAKPRHPQGKGKQERFNLTVDSFLAEISLRPPETLAELNAKFQAWLSECYHGKEHSALGTTPEIAFIFLDLRGADEYCVACKTQREASLHERLYDGAPAPLP